MGGSHEDELWAACQKGTEDAFRKLFDHYHKRVFQIAFRLCPSIEEAEDAVQEVFIRVYREIHNFNAAAGFFTWLYRITVNLCLDKSRKRQRREKYHANTDSQTGFRNLDDVSSISGETSLYRELWRDELQQMLHQALIRLKPKLRTAIVLKDLEGISYREVAQILGCSEGTVSSRLSRGRKQLKKHLTEMGLDETYFQEN